MTDWRARAACHDADPELFAPVGERWVGKANDQRAEQARAWCRACPVLTDCLGYALRADDQYMFLAGTLPDQRRALRAELVS